MFAPDAAERKRYGNTVHSLPALIRNAGLSQALHFVRSRRKAECDLVLDHLASQLARVDPTIRDRESLLNRVRLAELGKYLRLTQEALACVHWYKRFVQGELGVESSDDGADR